MPSGCARPSRLNGPPATATTAAPSARAMRSAPCSQTSSATMANTCLIWLMPPTRRKVSKMRIWSACYARSGTNSSKRSIVMSSSVQTTALVAENGSRHPMTTKRYVDSGYVGGNTIAASRLLGEDLLGPLRRGSSPQQRLPDGLTHADFQVDWDAKPVTCPQGHTTVIFPAGKLHDYQATFAAKICRDCPLRPRCCAGTKEGRSLRFGAYYPETVAARERQETQAFKEAYKQHRPEVEGCLSALVRGHGIRLCHYIGQAKNHLRALFVGAAVNLARAAAWRAGKRHRPKRLGLALAEAASG